MMKRRNQSLPLSLPARQWVQFTPPPRPQGWAVATQGQGVRGTAATCWLNATLSWLSWGPSWSVFAQRETHCIRGWVSGLWCVVIFCGVWRGVVTFCWVLRGVVTFCWVLRDVVTFCWVLRGVVTFCWVLRDVVTFCWVLRGVVTFCWVLRGVVTFCWVLRDTVQTCLVCAIGVEIYTFEAQTTHLCLHYTNYASDFISAIR